jgi:hypothetical protein
MHISFFYKNNFFTNFINCLLFFALKIFKFEFFFQTFSFFFLSFLFLPFLFLLSFLLFYLTHSSRTKLVATAQSCHAPSPPPAGAPHGAPPIHARAPSSPPLPFPFPLPSLLSHPVFKAKTRCSSYVCPGSCCHTYGQNVSTDYQCLYYIVSYYKKNLLQVQKGLNSGMDPILPQAVDRGFRTPRRNLHPHTPHLLSSRT